MADFGLPHSLFLYINKIAFKKFGAIDKFVWKSTFLLGSMSKKKVRCKIADGAKKFFKLMERVRQFPIDKVRDI